MINNSISKIFIFCFKWNIFILLNLFKLKNHNSLFHFSDEDVNKTMVRFQQSLSRDYFGNFTSSQVTLTLREDVELSPKTYLKMYTACEHNASKVQQKQNHAKIFTRVFDACALFNTTLHDHNPIFPFFAILGWIHSHPKVVKRQKILLVYDHRIHFVLSQGKPHRAISHQNFLWSVWIGQQKRNELGF